MYNNIRTRIKMLEKMSNKLNIVFKDYLVYWTDIYDKQHVNYVKAQNKTYAEKSIPSGDILKRIDKVEDAVWNDVSKKFISKPKLSNPYAHSKVPVYEGEHPDFWEYGSEFVPGQGEITDFDTAHAIAVNLLKDRPDTVLLRERDGSWWVGRMDNEKNS